MVMTHAMKILIFKIIILMAMVFSINARGIENESFPQFDKFRKSDGIYEPSGVVQLQDGRLVIAEDESSHPLSIVSIDVRGDIQVTPLKGEPLLISLVRHGGLRSLGRLDDLEGLAMGKDGYVYAVTSYSRTEGKGRVSRSREKFIRFRIKGHRVTDSEMIVDFKKSLTTHNARLAKAATVKGAKRIGGLEIEGLTFDKDRNKLLFGIRSPVKGKNAIIIVLENPSGVFNREDPRFREIYLDLDGAGIRGMTYDERLNGYLILTQKEAKKEKPFKLWYWNGEEDGEALKVKVAGVKSLRRAEGITPIKLGDKEGVLVFSDEGDHRRKKLGRYVLLRYDQLSIEQ